MFQQANWGWCAVALTALASPASAQTAEEVAAYRMARKSYGITQPVSPAALETAVGRHVYEVKGVVRGVIAINKSGKLILNGDGGHEIQVTFSDLPGWLDRPNVAARLIVIVEGTPDGGAPKSKLLAAAPEHAIAADDAEAERKAAEAAAKRQAAQTASRTGAAATRNARTNVRDRAFEVNSVNEALPYYVAYIKSVNKKIPDATAVEIARGVLGFSVHYGVDAPLVMAMVLVESGFNPGATSRAGAMGLGQLMPGTARSLGISNAYDVTENLYGTVRTIRGHIERYHAKTGDGYEALVLALAAYNAGSGAVRRFNGVPPYRETQAYVQKVISLYKRLRGWD